MQWVRMAISFFGVGFAPKAPGTLGTLAAVPLAFILMKLGVFVHMGFVIVLVPFAMWVCELYVQQTGKQDPQEAVIDEVAGFLITMAWLPLTWQSFVAGFLLFRLLDIFKPFPIGYLDKKIHGGIGVVVDDVVSGIIANIALQIVYNQTNWLGAQWLG